MQRGPLFIIGYPRSGTTLLRAILGAHSKVHLSNEPELIGGMRSAGFKTRDIIRRSDRRSLLEQLNSSGSCRRHLLALPPEVLTSFVEDHRDLSFKESYEYLLPKPDGIPIWGEKSLNNVFRIREICSMYPKALIVHIIRDPQSALLSYYRKRFANSADSLPEFGRKAIHFFVYRAMQWSTWAAAVRESSISLDKDVLQLRYEDLVTNPEHEVRRICNALSLEFDHCMLDPARRKEDKTVKGDASYAHKRLLNPVDSSRANSGKELPEWACFIIGRYARETLEGFGYTLNCSAVGLLTKLRLVAESRLSEADMRAKLRRMVTNRLEGRFEYLVP